MYNGAGVLRHKLERNYIEKLKRAKCDLKNDYIKHEGYYRAINGDTKGPQGLISVYAYGIPNN